MLQLLPVLEDRICDYMGSGEYVIHFFTDDHVYREQTMSLYHEAFDTGLVKMGPTEYDSKLAEKTSSAEGAKFKRGTTTFDAAVEFTCMALMNEFIGTAGSTVTYFVRAMNKRYATEFAYEEIIGEWHVPDRPTMKFRQQLKDFIEKAGNRLKENFGVVITHEQANVLDFLSDHHLEEMHTVLTKHLENAGGQMPGSKLGELFLKDCQVARMNKDRFKKCSPDRVGNQHWLKALLKGKLRQFSGRMAGIRCHVIMGPDATVRLLQKPSSAKASGEAASSSSSGPASKKMRIM